MNIDVLDESSTNIPDYENKSLKGDKLQHVENWKPQRRCNYWEIVEYWIFKLNEKINEKWLKLTKNCWKV